VNGWSDFYVAQVGASAALAGLLFVAISISLSDIVTYPNLPMRAAGTLTILATVLFTSMLMLIPDQSIRRAGFEVLGVGLVAAGVTLRMGVASARATPEEHRRDSRFSVSSKITATAIFMASGLLMAITDERGPSLIVLGCIVSYIVALVDAWVLLIEVHR
jgi:modulator of FtsH protease